MISVEESNAITWRLRFDPGNVVPILALAARRSG